MTPTRVGSSRKALTRCANYHALSDRAKLTCQDLCEQQGVFRTLIEEFGSSAQVNGTTREAEVDVGGAAKGKKPKSADAAAASGSKLMLDEERNMGSVSGAVYLRYLGAIGSWWYVIKATAYLLLAQGSMVGSSLFLGYWSGSEIAGFSQGHYMAVYAGQSRPE